MAAKLLATVSIGSPGPPEGATIPWWLEPPQNWPYPVPWEPKVFGAFPAMQIKMREDIGAPITDPPGPWPSGVTYPPFGFIKVNTPAYPKTGAHQLASVKVHMRPIDWLDVTPHPSVWAQGQFEEALRQMARIRPVKVVTESGTITLKSIRSANWYRPKEDIRGRRTRTFRPKTPNGNPDLFA